MAAIPEKLSWGEMPSPFKHFLRTTVNQLTKLPVEALTKFKIWYFSEYSVNFLVSVGVQFLVTLFLSIWSAPKNLFVSLKFVFF